MLLITTGITTHNLTGTTRKGLKMSINRYNPPVTSTLSTKFRTSKQYAKMTQCAAGKWVKYAHMKKERDLLLAILEAAVIQYDAFGAHPGLIKALEDWENREA